MNLNDLINLERMAEKSAQNLISAIEKSKDQPFEKVLFGLGIRYVGETVSKKITSKISDIDKLMKLSFDDLLKIEEIGDKIANSILDFFNNEENIGILNKLKSYGLKFEIDEKDRNILLTNNGVDNIENIFSNAGVLKNKNFYDLSELKRKLNS